MATDLTGRGYALFNMGRVDEARPLFDEALAATPDDPDALLGAALCHARTGDKKRALELATQAAPAAPGDLGLWHTYYMAICEAGTKEQALDVARRGIELFPNFAITHQDLAYVAADAKKKDEAFAAANKAIELNPNDADSHVALSYVAIKFRKWKESEQASRNALAIDSNDRAALNNLSVALENQRKHKEAIEISSRLAASNPDYQVATGNAKRQITQYAALPLIWVVFQLIRISATHYELGPAAFLPAVGLCLMVYGGFLTYRMEKLPEQQREIAKRVYRQKWYGRLLLVSPMRTLIIGVVIFIIGIGLVA